MLRMQEDVTISEFYEMKLMLF